jgi:small subunit ribosomal protein S16
MRLPAPGRAARAKEPSLWDGGMERFVAVKLRLKRFGRRHRACFRLGAMDVRSPRDGRVIEELGYYDPGAKKPEQQIVLNRERVEFWLKSGAQPTETVRHLLAKQGIVAK